MPTKAHEILVESIRSLGVEMTPVAGENGARGVYSGMCTQKQYDSFPDLKISMNGGNYYVPVPSYIVNFNGKCEMLTMSRDMSSRMIG